MPQSEIDEERMYQLLQGNAFPVSDRWYFRPVVKNNVKIAPGATASIIDEYSYGWLLSVYYICTSPKLTMQLLFESKQGNVELTLQPYNANLLFGASDAPSTGIGFVLRKYDRMKSIFTYSMYGVFPGAPWAGTLRLLARNDGEYEATILQIWIHRIIIESSKALPTKVTSTR